MDTKPASETVGEFITARRIRRRFLPYLSILILASIWLGLAGLLGYFPFPEGTPSAATAGEKVSAQSRSPEPPSIPPLFTVSASDIPLLQSLQERHRVVEEREKHLTEREQTLHFLQQQIEEKLESLTTLRKEIGALIEEKEAFEEKRFEHLVKVYEGMKPEEAASLIERLQEDTAAKLFYRMKEKKVSQLLGFVKPEVAAKLSERLAALQQKDQQKAGDKGKL